MLLWGVFTVGYLVGVMVTLKFFVREEEQGTVAVAGPDFAAVKNKLATKSSLSSLSGYFQHDEVFRILTRVNYRKEIHPAT